MSPTAKATKKSTDTFSEEERAALRETLKERRARKKGGNVDGEAEVMAKIREMTPADRAIAERIHAIVKSVAPSLVPRTWYGMPAYSRDDEVVCFFQGAAKFKTRYATLGFSDEAKLDDGSIWPVAYAVTNLTKVDEARIAELLRRALST